MNRVFKPIINFFKKTNVALWIFTLTATVYGLFLVASATRNFETNRTLITQIVALFIGYVAAIIISFIDYEDIVALWKPISVICILLILLTYFFGKQVEGTDDKAWLLLPGNISFQPGELAKVGFMITFGYHLSILQKRNLLKSFWNVVLLFCHVAIPMVMIHLQGDDGTALVFLFIFLAMMWGAGIQARYFLAVIATLVVALPLLYFFVLDDTKIGRINTMFNPELDILGAGFHQHQAKISIASGELMGRGYYQGPRLEKGSVPESHNDMIFSVAGEELGFIGCIAIILILTLILLQIIRIAKASRDPLGQYLCYGLFGWICFQMIENIGMCLSLLPVVGIPLPFFTAGGSSSACLFLAVGLIQSVYAHRNQNQYRTRLNIQPYS